MKKKFFLLMRSVIFILFIIINQEQKASNSFISLISDDPVIQKVAAKIVFSGITFGSFVFLSALVKYIFNIGSKKTDQGAELLDKIQNFNKNTINELGSQCEQQIKDISRLHKENDTLVRDQINNIEVKMNDTLKNYLGTLNQKIIDYKKEINSLEDNIKKIETEMEGRVKTIEQDNKNTIVDIKKENKNQIDDYKIEIKNIENLINTLENNYKQDITALKNDFTNQVSTISSLYTSSIDLIKKIHEKNIEDIQKYHNEKIPDIENKIELMKKSIFNIEEKFDKTIQEIKGDNAKTIEEMKEGNANTIQEIKQDNANTIQEIKEGNANTIQEIKEDNVNTIQEIKDKISNIREETTKKIQDITTSNQETIQGIKQDNVKTIEEMKKYKKNIEEQIKSIEIKQNKSFNLQEAANKIEEGKLEIMRKDHELKVKQLNNEKLKDEEKKIFLKNNSDEIKNLIEKLNLECKAFSLVGEEVNLDKLKKYEEIKKKIDFDLNLLNEEAVLSYVMSQFNFKWEAPSQQEFKKEGSGIGEELQGDVPLDASTAYVPPTEYLLEDSTLSQAVKNWLKALGKEEKNRKSNPNLYVAYEENKEAIKIYFEKLENFIVNLDSENITAINNNYFNEIVGEDLTEIILFQKTVDLFNIEFKNNLTSDNIFYYLSSSQLKTLKNGIKSINKEKTMREKDKLRQYRYFQIEKIDGYKKKIDEIIKEISSDEYSYYEKYSSREIKQASDLLVSNECNNEFKDDNETQIINILLAKQYEKFNLAMEQESKKRKQDPHRCSDYKNNKFFIDQYLLNLNNIVSSIKEANIEVINFNQNQDYENLIFSLDFSKSESCFVDTSLANLNIQINLKYTDSVWNLLDSNERKKIRACMNDLKKEFELRCKQKSRVYRWYINQNKQLVENLRRKITELTEKIKLNDDTVYEEYADILISDNNEEDLLSKIIIKNNFDDLEADKLFDYFNNELKQLREAFKKEAELRKMDSERCSIGRSNAGLIKKYIDNMDSFVNDLDEKKINKKINDRYLEIDKFIIARDKEAELSKLFFFYTSELYRIDYQASSFSIYDILNFKNKSKMDSYLNRIKKEQHERRSNIKKQFNWYLREDGVEKIIGGVNQRIKDFQEECDKDSFAKEDLEKLYLLYCKKEQDKGNAKLNNEEIVQLLVENLSIEDSIDFNSMQYHIHCTIFADSISKERQRRNTHPERNFYYQQNKDYINLIFNKINQYSKILGDVACQDIPADVNNFYDYMKKNLTLDNDMRIENINFIIFSLIYRYLNEKEIIKNLNDEELSKIFFLLTLDQTRKISDIYHLCKKEFELRMIYASRALDVEKKKILSLFRSELEKSMINLASESLIKNEEEIRRLGNNVKSFFGTSLYECLLKIYAIESDLYKYFDEDDKDRVAALQALLKTAIEDTIARKEDLEKEKRMFENVNFLKNVDYNNYYISDDSEADDIVKLNTEINYVNKQIVSCKEDIKKISDSYNQIIKKQCGEVEESIKARIKVFEAEKKTFFSASNIIKLKKGFFNFLKNAVNPIPYEKFDMWNEEELINTLLLNFGGSCDKFNQYNTMESFFEIENFKDFFKSNSKFISIKDHTVIFSNDFYKIILQLIFEFQSYYVDFKPDNCLVDKFLFLIKYLLPVISGDIEGEKLYIIINSNSKENKKIAFTRFIKLMMQELQSFWAIDKNYFKFKQHIREIKNNTKKLHIDGDFLKPYELEFMNSFLSSGLNSFCGFKIQDCFGRIICQVMNNYDSIEDKINLISMRLKLISAIKKFIININLEEFDDKYGLPNLDKQNENKYILSEEEKIVSDFITKELNKNFNCYKNSLFDPCQFESSYPKGKGPKGTDQISIFSQCHWKDLRHIDYQNILESCVKLRGRDNVFDEKDYEVNILLAEICKKALQIETFMKNKAEYKEEIASFDSIKNQIDLIGEKYKESKSDYKKKLDELNLKKNTLEQSIAEKRKEMDLLTERKNKKDSGELLSKKSFSDIPEKMIKYLFKIKIINFIDKIVLNDTIFRAWYSYRSNTEKIQHNNRINFNDLSILFKFIQYIDKLEYNNFLDMFLENNIISNFDEFKKILRMYINSCINISTDKAHYILSGEPGTGKTAFLPNALRNYVDSCNNQELAVWLKDNLLIYKISKGYYDNNSTVNKGLSGDIKSMLGKHPNSILCVLYDECDKFIENRRLEKNNIGRDNSETNNLLTLLDSGEKSPFIFLGTTNTEANIDSAVIREGRTHLVKVPFVNTYIVFQKILSNINKDKEDSLKKQQNAENNLTDVFKTQISNIRKLLDIPEQKYNECYREKFKNMPVILNAIEKGLGS